MSNMKLLLAIPAASLLALAACDSATPPPAAPVEDVIEEPAGPTAMETLAGNADLSTLVDLINQADMGPFVDGAESYTLFAPNNAAFEKLDASTVAFLTAPENASSLKQVLGYHLLRNAMPAGDLVAAIEGGASGESVMTSSNSLKLTGKLNEDGAPVIVDANGGEASVVTADIMTDNGVVHVIDTVLMPPSS